MPFPLVQARLSWSSQATVPSLFPWWPGLLLFSTHIVAHPASRHHSNSGPGQETAKEDKVPVLKHPVPWGDEPEGQCLEV